MTLSSTKLSVLVEFLPLLRFSYFDSCLSFLAKDCQGKECRSVTLVNTSRELGNLLTGLHTVPAAVTYSRPEWCSARALSGAFYFFQHLCYQRQPLLFGPWGFCFLPITLFELKKKITEIQFHKDFCDQCYRLEG